LSLAAAIATIREIVDKKVPDYLWKLGSKLMNGLNSISQKFDTNIKFTGFPIRMRPTCKDDSGNESLEVKSLFLQEMVSRGIFMHPSVNYVNFSHTKKDILKTHNAFEESSKIVEEAIRTNSVKKRLRGEVINPVFPPKKK